MLQNCIELLADLKDMLQQQGCIIIGFGGEHDVALDYETLMMTQENSALIFYR